MKTNLVALALILSPALCPFLAHAQNVDGAWRNDLVILSSPAKLGSLQNLVTGKRNPLPNLSSPKELEAFSQKLRDKAQLLEKQASGGVDSGGGGNLILYKNGELKLLDLVVYPALSSSSNPRPAMVLPLTPSMRAWGVDRLRLGEFAQSSLLNDKVKAWGKSSPFTTAILAQALSNLPVYIVDYEFQIQDQNYFLPLRARSSSIQGIITAAIYLKDYGVLVSKKYFEKLDFENQVGLLMHESLRHAQLTYGYANSDQSLQKLTAALMRGPKPGESLDSPEYLDGNLLRSFIAQAELEMLALKVIPEGCKAYEAALKKSCSLKEVSSNEVLRIYTEISDFLQTPNTGASDELKNWVYYKSKPLMPLSYELSKQDLLGAVQGSKDAAVSINKSLSTSALDIISKDFNERGYFWSPYKSEARKIIQDLKAANILR